MTTPFAVLCLAAGLVLTSAPMMAQTPEDALHTPDGNVQDMFNSILIPPLANAPFVATVNAEWTRQLPDATTITLKNHRILMRDSKGRIYQERRQLTSDGDQQESQLTRIEISDPAQHIKYFCSPFNRVCVLRAYFMPIAVPVTPVGPLDKGSRYLSREDLGKEQVSGLEAIGTRETITTDAGAMGNDAPVAITKEFWYSPRVDLNLSVKRVDPLHGTQLITVNPIQFVEPDPRMFAPPAGYKVVDERGPSVQAKQTGPAR